MSATVVYSVDIFNKTIERKSYQTRHWSFVITVISVPLFFFHMILLLFVKWRTTDSCKVLEFQKTFWYIVLVAIGHVISPNQYRKCVLFLLQLTGNILLTVALFVSPWMDMLSTTDRKTVLIKFWQQCRNVTTLQTCCSDVSDYFTRVPDWFVACRTIITSAFSIGLVALVFHFVRIFKQDFQKPADIAQAFSSILLMAGCIKFAVDNAAFNQLGAGFFITVFVTALLLIYLLAVLLYSIGICPDEWSCREKLGMCMSFIKQRITCSGGSDEEQNQSLLGSNNREQYQQQSKCFICFENPLQVRLDPCGHTCCSSCADLLQEPLCPMCRTSIQQCQRIYI